MARSMYIFGGFFVLAIAVLIALFNKYYMYIPRIIADIKYPIQPNQEVIWQVPPPALHSSQAPNIVLILADDLGFNDVTFYGGGFLGNSVPTPNIDSIGKDGAAFYNAYAGQGTCAPSRASLMSGRFPTKLGYEFTPVAAAGAKAIAKMATGKFKGIHYSQYSNEIGFENMVPPVDMITIPKLLKQQNYRTLQLGKWHLGTTENVRPINQGFDETLESPVISMYYPFSHPDAVNCVFDNTLDRFFWATSRYEVKRNNNTEFMAPGRYYTDYMAEEAAKAITANKDHPFFMYLAFTAPHSPFQATKSDYDQFPNIKEHCSRVYAAMLLSLDRAVGTVLDSLKANGLSDNTLVVFTSDNGGASYVGEPDLNKPYRGWKGTLFEGGVHIPMFMKWPSQIPAGQRLKTAVVSQLDILPTAFAAATGGNNVQHEIDGINLLPLVRTAEPPAEYIQHTIDRTLFWRSSHYKALRRGNWKIQAADRPKKIWLFNLAEDPTEHHNLAYQEQHMHIQMEMMALVMMHDFNQTAPIWNARSEVPVSIDGIGKPREGDDYVYWAN